MAITYDKDGAYIEVTENGIVYRRAIKWKDCVVSVPSNGNQKVDLAYVNSSDQLVLVLEDESELIVTGGGVTDHGGLTGLLDDDHTQYLLATGIRAASEIRLTPKTSSSGPEGTIFYDSDDDHVYVGTE